MNDWIDFGYFLGFIKKPMSKIKTGDVIYDTSVNLPYGLICIVLRVDSSCIYARFFMNDVFFTIPITNNQLSVFPKKLVKKYL